MRSLAGTIESNRIRSNFFWFVQWPNRTLLFAGTCVPYLGLAVNIRGLDVYCGQEVRRPKTSGRVRYWVSSRAVQGGGILIKIKMQEFVSCLTLCLM